MSYGATVEASAARPNTWSKLNWIQKIIFTPVLNKSYDFSKWFIDYLKNANEFKLFVCCCWYLVFTSVDLLPFKIKIFDRLRIHVYLLSSSHFGNITAMFEISLCLFRSNLPPPPPCVISCVIQIPKITTLCLPYTLILGCTLLNNWHLRHDRTSTHPGRPVKKLKGCR